MFHNTRYGMFYYLCTKMYITKKLEKIVRIIFCKYSIKYGFDKNIILLPYLQLKQL